ncbi:hypothetical protein [Kitasatospora sp. NPDC086791]|uniref:hypothetical protein n=1 Tax=Kitasatospora sp. NPDC086791 TaxID=3155178 RepID=UPI0034252122
MAAAAIGWWAITAPYVAAGLRSDGQYPLPLAWVAALFLPMAGYVGAGTIAKAESRGRRMPGGKTVLVLLLAALSVGYSVIGFPVGHPGHGGWQIPVMFGSLNLFWSYLVPYTVLVSAAEEAKLAAAKESGATS